MPIPLVIDTDKAQEHAVAALIRMAAEAPGELTVVCASAR